MSTKAVLDFWMRAAADEALQRKVKSLPPTNRADAIVKLGAQNGCAFTKAEVEEVGAAGTFLFRARTDAGLRAKVAAARKLGGRETQRSEVMRIAADAGFRFKAEHLSQVAEMEGAGGPLSDRELDRVAGGALPVLGLAGAGLALAVGAAAGYVLYNAVSDVAEGVSEHQKKEDKGFKANPETGEGCTRPTWGGSGGGLPGFP